jgi:hypothetical protein
MTPMVVPACKTKHVHVGQFGSPRGVGRGLICVRLRRADMLCSQMLTRSRRKMHRFDQMNEFLCTNMSHKSCVFGTFSTRPSGYLGKIFGEEREKFLTPPNFKKTLLPQNVRNLGWKTLLYHSSFFHFSTTFGQRASPATPPTWTPTHP